MNRKKLNRFRGISAISIALIISLGLMGVCYGMWTESLNIDADLFTGHTDAQVIINDRDLTVKLSDDGRTIYLDGEIYRDSIKDIDIMVKNTGTVPLVFDKIEETILSEITELNRKKNKKSSLLSFPEDDTIDSFNLRISAFEENENTAGFRFYDDVSISQEVDEIQREINTLHSGIRELEDEIARLSKIKSYNFKYILHLI
ncbi:MAG TPA: hypothetical protein VFC70_00980, partial [Oscillospiraceae bacterium]|nr:hypothetical protein [Oscillospiraceae bacterium]